MRSGEQAVGRSRDATPLGGDLGPRCVQGHSTPFNSQRAGPDCPALGVPLASSRLLTPLQVADGHSLLCVPPWTPLRASLSRHRTWDTRWPGRSNGLYNKLGETAQRSVLTSSSARVCGSPPGPHCAGDPGPPTHPESTCGGPPGARGRRRKRVAVGNKPNSVPATMQFSTWWGRKAINK